MREYKEGAAKNDGCGSAFCNACCADTGHPRPVWLRLTKWGMPWIEEGAECIEVKLWGMRFESMTPFQKKNGRLITLVIFSNFRFY